MRRGWRIQRWEWFACKWEEDDGYKDENDLPVNEKRMTDTKMRMIYLLMKRGWRIQRWEQLEERNYHHRHLYHSAMGTQPDKKFYISRFHFLVYYAQWDPKYCGIGKPN